MGSAITRYVYLEVNSTVLSEAYCQVRVHKMIPYNSIFAGLASQNSTAAYVENAVYNPAE